MKEKLTAFTSNVKASIFRICEVSTFYDGYILRLDIMFRNQRFHAHDRRRPDLRAGSSCSQRICGGAQLAVDAGAVVHVSEAWRRRLSWCCLWTRNREAVPAVDFHRWISLLYNLLRCLISQELPGIFAAYYCERVSKSFEMFLIIDI